jgi:hypothetical protein
MRQHRISTQKWPYCSYCNHYFPSPPPHGNKPEVISRYFCTLEKNIDTKNHIVLLIENFHARNFDWVETYALNKMSFLLKIKGRYNLQGC